MNKNSERGLVNPLIIITIVLGVFTVGFAAFSIWAYVNYQDFKNNTDQKVVAATADAKRQQKEQDEAAFLEREKQPTRDLIGPDDLGRVALSYPKTWSVYIDKSDKSSYEAYLHPGVVPSLDSKTPYALRVSIVNSPYEKEVANYEKDVEDGDLKASSITLKGEKGTRLEGALEKDIQGVLVLLKVRDKTLKIYTESRTFEPDFKNIILPSLSFNR